jgi:hypothetical protein
MMMMLLERVFRAQSSASAAAGSQIDKVNPRYGLLSVLITQVKS